MRVALLCSKRAPGLSYLLQDNQRGRDYDLVVGMATDAASTAVPALRHAGIPALVRDLRGFYAAKPGARLRDLAVRREYDTGTVEVLQSFQPDVVVLSGYRHIVTSPLLAAYHGRVINVHDADLTLLDEAGRPRYRGLHATRDAVLAGEPETRCTAHLATEELEAGPVLVRSGPFPTHPLVHDARRWGAIGILRAYAYAQKEWMVRAAWGPLIAGAVQLFGRRGARAVPG